MPATAALRKSRGLRAGPSREQVMRARNLGERGDAAPTQLHGRRRSRARPSSPSPILGIACPNSAVQPRRPRPS